MSKQQSGGSKLGGFAGFVIVISFFLPWVRACNRELSGYALATNQPGGVEDAWVYWLTLLAGLICLALYFLVRSDNAGGRIKAATVRLIVGLVGFIPVLNVWYNVQQRGSAIEILYGGWLIAVGYLGVFISFFVDLGGSSGDSHPT